MSQAALASRIFVSTGRMSYLSKSKLMSLTAAFALKTKLKKTEEELQSERERRVRLEMVLSQGKK